MRVASSAAALMLLVRLVVVGAGGAGCHAALASAPRPLLPSNDEGGEQETFQHAISRREHGGMKRTFSFDDCEEAGRSAPGELAAGETDAVGCSFLGLRRRRRGLDLRRRALSAVRSTFLPSGYPSRTPPGYLRHCMWSWAQDLSTQLRSVLATQRVLEGVGVGREGATALSASINFIVRDGCGMAATLLFTAVAGGRFGADVKRWRLVADLAVDAGITLEVLANAVPRSLFLPVICVANMCKAVCGVAAGACGSAINLHWASGSDVSDVGAKSGAQHTVTGALGLVSAAVFARSVSDAPGRVLWSLYCALTALHIYANMMCMKLVAFDRVNGPRMALLASDFLSGWRDGGGAEIGRAQSPTAGSSALQANATAGVVDASTVPLTMETPRLGTPKSIARREPLFFLWRKPPVLPSLPVRMGVSFNEFAFLSGKSVEELRNMAAEIEARKEKERVLGAKSSVGSYLIAAGRRRRSRHHSHELQNDRWGRGGGGGCGNTCILIAFLATAAPEDRARAYLHAALLGKSLGGKDRGGIEEAIWFRGAELEAGDAIVRAWPAFAKGAAESGWNLEGGSDIRTEGYAVEFS